MRKSKFFIIVILFCILSLLHFSRNQSHHSHYKNTRSTNSISSQKTISKYKKSDKNKQVFVIRKSIQKTSFYPAQKDCAAKVKDWLSSPKEKMSLNESLKVSRSCPEQFIAPNFNIEGYSLNDCLKEQAVEDKEMAMICENLFIGYRIYMNIINKSKSDLSQSHDEELLLGLYAFKYNLSNKNIDRYVELIKELQKRLPEHPEVAKTTLMPFGINDPVELGRHLRENFEKAKEMNPDDPEIQAIDMFLAVTENETNILESLKEFSMTNPNSGIAEFYSAGIHLMQGNNQLAKQSILKAIKTEPTNNMYKEALDAINGDRQDVTFLVINGVGFKIDKNQVSSLFQNFSETN